MASESRKLFPCNTCYLTFTCSALQRSHMQQPWHIHNLRQKILGNPAISEEEYNTLHTVAPKTSRHRPQLHDSVERLEKRGARIIPKRNLRVISQSPIEEQDATAIATNHHDPVPDPSPGTQCLFCSNTLPSLSENVHHMSATHGLFIPRLNRIVDLECFLAYLGVLVYEYRECVYCGAGKNTVQAAQTHMRDKGHCKIDVGELGDFWEADASEGGDEDQDDNEEGRSSTKRVEAQDTSLDLQTDPIPAKQPSNSSTTLTRIMQRQKPSPSFPSTNETQHQSTNRGEPLDSTIQTSRDRTNFPPSSRDLTKSNRDLANLNLPLSQLRSLATLDRRMKTHETTARARIQHKAERQPVKCVYYKTENPVYQAG